MQRPQVVVSQKNKKRKEKKRQKLYMLTLSVKKGGRSFVFLREVDGLEVEELHMLSCFNWSRGRCRK